MTSFRDSSDNYLLQWAVRSSDGVLVNIDSVPNGLACNCVCPSCGCQLEARNAGEIRAHHFAHYTDLKAHHEVRRGDFSGGCSVNDETIIHRAAKQVLAESVGKQMLLPAELFYTYLSAPIEVTKARSVTIGRVEIEATYEDIIPDAVIYTTGGEKILFEVYVSHRVDDDKLEKLRRIGLPCIEADLRRLSASDGNLISCLQNALLTDSSHKKWVYTPELARLDEKKHAFDKLNMIGAPLVFDPCILLPKNKVDHVFRCKECCFYAGIADNYLYCSASQLLNLRDIKMPESEVALLAERLREEYIYDHDRQVSELIIKAEKAIADIGTVSLESMYLISRARSRYENLSDEAKKSVSNYADLERAEAILAALIEENQKRKELEQQAKDVDKEIEKLLFSYNSDKSFDYSKYYNQMKDGSYSPQSPKLYAEQTAYAKWRYDELSEDVKVLVTNKALLDNAISTCETRRKEIEERKASAERNRIQELKEKEEIEEYLKRTPYKRKKIYINKAGNCMVAGGCPLSAATDSNDKFYAECHECQYCEINLNYTGPEQFIICNAIEEP